MTTTPKLSIEWTSGIQDQKEKEELVKTILASKTALKALARIAAQSLESLDREEVANEDFDNPSWSHKQANRLGQKKVYRRILELTKFAQ